MTIYLPLTTQFAPTQGPICLYAEEESCCYEHDSCERIIREVDPTLYDGLGFCRNHGFQKVTEFGSNPGFCAGNIYWANLACGCQQVEDNSYLEA